MEAAADAVKNPPKVEEKLTDSQPPETFEEVAVEKRFEFPTYKAADFFEILQKHHHCNFKAIVRGILEIEAPLSEDFLLRRIIWYFDREELPLPYNATIHSKCVDINDITLSAEMVFYILIAEKDSVSAV